jgi:hypothetical protein
MLEIFVTRNFIVARQEVHEFEAAEQEINQ